MSGCSNKAGGSAIVTEQEITPDNNAARGYSATTLSAGARLAEQRSSWGQSSRVAASSQLHPALSGSANNDRAPNPGNPLEKRRLVTAHVDSRSRSARASYYRDSVPHCRNSPNAYQVRGRAIPCSDGAKQRHYIIPNRLALTAEESVSGVTGATAQVNQETPPMRSYIIGNDGIT
ncbi:MAG: hypothetical protein WBX30_19235, partial [Stellaceae bacterium]